MLTKFLPMPADSGGKQRSLAEAQRLAEIGSLQLLAFRDELPDVESLNDLAIHARGYQRPTGYVDLVRGMARTRSFTAARFSSAEMLDAVKSAAVDPIDMLLVGHAQMAPYAPYAKARHTVLDLHNVESSLASSYRASTQGLRAVGAAVEAVALRRIERRAMTTFDVVMTVSDRDRRRLPEGTAELLVCPNGCAPLDLLPPARAPVAVFVALMAWRPNVEAVQFLADRVWPLVRRAVPGARLRLVGRDPAPAVLAAKAPDIEVTGRVESVQPHLREARVALAPLLAGGGSRLKILEALAVGRPVVATGIGAEGLEDLIGHGVVTADAPAALAQEISRLLLEPELAERLGRLGRERVASRYSWDTTLRPLLERSAMWADVDGTA